MNNNKISKYKPFVPISLPDRTWPDKKIDKAPIWCSVDLRDGNQALATPMTIEEKVKMFKLLVDIGFKEIEVGFPSASDTEFYFLRKLVDDNLIPDDVVIQVLVQARKELILRTFDSLKGVKNAIVHLYNSTSPLQRRITFSDASKDKIKKIAVDGAKLIKSLVKNVEDTNIALQYSPESFSDTEADFSIEICEAVMDVWQPTKENKIILNLPATVEWNMPNTYADQIEYFCRKIKNRDSVIISLHTHNDRGTGVAATELGLLAGADRVEGTLFGNGERTGNLDLVIVALNMNSHGVVSNLNFSELDNIKRVYTDVTKMQIPKRQPYAGELVFTAFSGSHQDAIKKGMDRLTEIENLWAVPYLTIDPQDIGSDYEAIIRINSQSGKGGVAFILNQEYGFDLPKEMHPEVGKFINGVADSFSKELSKEEILTYFKNEFVNRKDIIELVKYKVLEMDNETDRVHSTVEILHYGKNLVLEGYGNGPIDATSEAVKNMGLKDFQVIKYSSHSTGKGSDSKSSSYIALKLSKTGKTFWGCGLHTSIRKSGLLALASAYNRAVKEQNKESNTEQLVVNMSEKS